jgi:WD40 repeat protein
MKKLWSLIIMGMLFLPACNKSEIDTDKLGTQVAAEIFASQTAAANANPTLAPPAAPKYAVISQENVKDLKELGRWISHPILDLIYAPAGGRILALTPTGIKLYEDENLEPITSWETDEPLWTLAISPDGEMLAASGETGINLWRIDDGRLIRTIDTPSWADPLIFSPDGALLAAQTWGGIQTWLASDGSQVQTIETYDNVFAFHPSGRISSISANRDAENIWFYAAEWDAYTGQEMGGWAVQVPVTDTWDEEDQYLYDFGMVFSPDGGSAALWWQGSLALVQIQGYTARILSKLDDENIDDYSSVFFSPDGKSLIIDADQIQVLQVPDLTPIRTFAGAYPTLSPDGQVLAMLGEQGIEQWRLSDGTFIRSAPYSFITDYSLSADGELLAISKSDGVVEVWSLESTEPRYVYQSPQPGSSQAILSPDGNLLATGMSSGPWDMHSLRDGSLLYSLEDVASLQFTEDGQHMLTWSQGSPEVLIRQASDGAIIHTMQHPVEINQLVATEDGAIIAAAIADGTIWLWSSADGVLQRTIDDESIPVQFSPEGEYLLTRAQDGTFKIWIVETGELLGSHSLEAGQDTWQYSLCGELFVLQHEGRLAYWRIGEDTPTTLDEVYWAQCSPDGMYLAATTWEEGVKVWQTDGSALLYTLSEAYEPVQFSPDSGILMTISHSGENLQLWSLRDGTLLREFETSKGWLVGTGFVSEGRLLMVNAAQSLFLWGLPIQ